MTGTDLEGIFVKEASAIGYECFKMDRLPGGKSNPDQLVMGYDRSFWIEFKSEHEEVKGHQKKRHRDFMCRGVGMVVVCREMRHVESMLASLLQCREQWRKVVKCEL